MLARVADRRDLAFDAALAEAAGNEDRIHVLQRLELQLHRQLDRLRTADALTEEEKATFTIAAVLTKARNKVIPFVPDADRGRLLVLEGECDTGKSSLLHWIRRPLPFMEDTTAEMLRHRARHRLAWASAAASRSGRVISTRISFSVAGAQVGRNLSCSSPPLGGEAG